jgi:periplasmic protein TonB
MSSKYPMTIAGVRGGGLGVSMAMHLLVALAMAWIATSPSAVRTQVVSDPSSRPDLIWIASAGLGGGGGGGDGSPVAGAAQQPGRHRLTVPVRSNRAVENDVEPPEEHRIDIPARPMAAGIDSVPGIVAPSGAADTRGPGGGPGADTGIGPGSGPGDGPGLGPGRGPGSGPSEGGGSGVTPPRLLRNVKPSYTAEAMRAKVQGLVRLSCIVLPDGTVGDVHVVQSLDATFGLDEEAIKAAKQWRFTPAMRFGQPVATAVTLVLEFHLR